MQPESPQNNNTFKSLLLRLWNVLRRNPLQKLAALLIAFVFWAILIASDPTLLIERVILNAPVTVTGQDTLRNTRGLIVMDDIASGTITVKMRVEVRQEHYDRATVEYFTPRLELASQIIHEGPEQRVYFSAQPSIYGTVLSFEPEYVTLDVEAYTSRSRVPVVVEQAGEATTPLWLETPIPDPSQVSVSGPKSLVDQVRRAVVQLPLGSLSSARPQDSISSAIELQDAAGNPIASSLIRVTNDSIAVTDTRIDVNVYPMRDIPVSVDNIVTGEPGHGYRLDEVKITPSHVAIAAEEEILDELEALFVAAPVDISGKTDTVIATSPLRPLSGVAHIAAEEVTIEAVIVPAIHVHAYNNLPVTIMGASPDLDGKLSHTEMDAIIRGDYDKTQALKQEDIMLYVDADGLDEGVHAVEVLCLVNGTDTFDFEAEFPKVTLTLTRQ